MASVFDLTPDEKLQLIEVLWTTFRRILIKSQSANGKRKNSNGVRNLKRTPT